MILPVYGMDLPNNVGDRPGHQIHIPRDHRRQKSERHVYPSSLEVIDSSSRHHPQINLRQGLHRPRFVAHQAPEIAVNLDHGMEFLLRSCPVARCIVSQPVSERPHAEVWVAGDQWDGGWAEGRLAGRRGQKNNDEKDTTVPAQIHSSPCHGVLPSRSVNLQLSFNQDANPTSTVRLLMVALSMYALNPHS